MSDASREQAVRRWLRMWLERRCDGLEELFTPDAAYIESWGPEYHGAAAIRHWFEEWNTRGAVLEWSARRFFHREGETAVFWRFASRMDDGRADAFEGVSLILWAADGRIRLWQEFGCNENRYDPYAHGPAPRFREEPARWF